MKTTKPSPWNRRADHADVVATQRGFRATVVDRSGRILASEHFASMSLIDLREVDKAYDRMKHWLAGWGVN